MFCRKCGEKLEDDAKFCRFCGSRVEYADNIETVQKAENKPVQIGGQTGFSEETETLEKEQSKETIIPPKRRNGNGVMLIVVIIAVFAIAVLLLFLTGQNKKFGMESTENTTIETVSAETVSSELEPTAEHTQEETGEETQIDIETMNGNIWLDSDDIYIEYRGITESTDNVWSLNLYIENNRNSQISVSLKNTCFNDNLIRLSNNGVDVPAQSKHLTGPQFDFVFDLEEMSEYGITAIDKITADLIVETEFLGDMIATTHVVIEEAKDILATEPIDKSTDIVEILNTDDYYAEYRGISKWSDDCWILNIYFENKTDKEVYLSIENNRINRFLFDLSNNGTTIPPHSRYLASPNFELIMNVDDFEAYGITSIEELDFDLCILSEWAGDILSETPVHIEAMSDSETEEETVPATTESSSSKRVTGSGSFYKGVSGSGSFING